jgi:hypothetical protein
MNGRKEHCFFAITIVLLHKGKSLTVEKRRVQSNDKYRE